LAVICSMMGIPQEDWALMFDLTNRGLGPADPEYQTVPGNPQETAEQSRREMFAYFAAQAAARRQERRDDLVSVLVGSEIDGESRRGTARRAPARGRAPSALVPVREPGRGGLSQC